MAGGLVRCERADVSRAGPRVCRPSGVDDPPRRNDSHQSDVLKRKDRAGRTPSSGPPGGASWRNAPNQKVDPDVVTIPKQRTIATSSVTKITLESSIIYVARRLSRLFRSLSWQVLAAECSERKSGRSSRRASGSAQPPAQLIACVAHRDENTAPETGVFAQDRLDKRTGRRDDARDDPTDLADEGRRLRRERSPDDNERRVEHDAEVGDRDADERARSLRRHAPPADRRSATRRTARESSSRRLDRPSAASGRPARGDPRASRDSPARRNRSRHTAAPCTSARSRRPGSCGRAAARR